MNINEIRNLKSRIKNTKRQTVANSAINLQINKKQIQAEAVKRFKEKKLQYKKKTSVKQRVKGLVCLGSLCIVIMFSLGMVLKNNFFKPQETLSMDEIVEIDQTSEEAAEIKKACNEFFHDYRKKGTDGIKIYLDGLPPFLIENSILSLSTFSRYDNVEIVNMRKDTRVECYQVNCAGKNNSKSIVLSITKAPTGKLKLVSIN